jgi:coenzyme F420-0:L-glutamate ligase/coenzyme F420-1:gamma-L-glutamate ligase
VAEKWVPAFAGTAENFAHIRLFGFLTVGKRPVMPAAVSLIPLSGVPLIEPGDDLGHIAAAALRANGLSLEDDDVLVVAQKIVSKAEGRIVDLAQVSPSAEALVLAAETGKDPRLVEIILSEAKRVVRRRPGLIIVEHRLGFVMANAGVDHSNVAMPGGSERVLLLPRDPDGSARALRQALMADFGKRVAVVVNDSFGRPWRCGVAGVALGAAGLPALIDRRGHPDLFGRPLLVTEIGFADEIAAAASLVMGQADEGLPIVLVRGLAWSAPEVPAAALVRPAERDLFR